MKLTYFKILIAEIKMNLKEAFSYKVGIISDIIVMLILYCSTLFIKGYSSISQYYDVSDDMSKSLVLQGYIFWSFAVLILGSISNSISIDAAKGTLEQKSMSVIPMQVLMLGGFFAELIINLIVVFAIYLGSRIMFNIDIKLNVMTIITLFIMIIGMYGLGLALGGISLVSKRISNLVYIFQIILLFISNAVMQVDSVAEYGNIFPVSLGISIGRKFILGEYVSNYDFLIFVMNCGIWCAAGIFIFEVFMRYSKYRGIFSNY